MEKENCYLTLMDACKVSAERLDEGQLLDDGANDWGIDNLIDEVYNSDSEELDGEDNYYCVGYDGSIGITHDNGYNVEWIYKVK